ncbi:MAG TPA: CerR family C-terminal domain-containing protein [Blastocatellia bacterium]|nr:CerR family C-terminal domain-containing protein [Blastocatellia bacterium]
MARPKTDDPEARAKIISAAQELFAVRGYDGAAIRDIARAAGVNAAMIHYYFGNKEGLYHTILNSAAAEVRARMIEETGGSHTAEQRLKSFVRAYATYIFGHPNLARILHREFLSGGKHIKEIAQQQYLTNYMLMREGLRAGVRAKELRPIDLDLAPISLIGMVLIFQIAQPLISLAIGKEKYDEQFINRLTDHTVDLFLNGAKVSARSKKATRNSSKKRRGAGNRAKVRL